MTAYAASTEKTQSQTHRWWPLNTRSSVNPSRFHSFTVLSLLAVANRRPSGDNKPLQPLRVVRLELAQRLKGAVVFAALQLPDVAHARGVRGDHKVPSPAMAARTMATPTSGTSSQLHRRRGKSHKRMFPFSSPEMSAVPFGCNAAVVTAPLLSYSRWCPPARTSHIFTVPSSLQGCLHPPALALETHRGDVAGVAVVRSDGLGIAVFTSKSRMWGLPAAARRHRLSGVISSLFTCESAY